MSDLSKNAIELARASQAAAMLLSDAVCNGCRSCISQISDLNRQASLDLSDAERRCLQGNESDRPLLSAILGLGECVARAFSAALLLSEPPAPLPPLCDVVTCNLQLAKFAEEILTDRASVSPYAFHLAANKGRGAHALLLTNYCNRECGGYLLPFILALEKHRDTLEHTCSLLVLSVIAKS